MRQIFLFESLPIDNDDTCYYVINAVIGKAGTVELNVVMRGCCTIFFHCTTASFLCAQAWAKPNGYEYQAVKLTYYVRGWVIYFALAESEIS